MDKNLPDWEKMIPLSTQWKYLFTTCFGHCTRCHGDGDSRRYQEAWEIFFPVLEELLSLI